MAWKRYIVICHKGTSTVEHQVTVYAPDLRSAKMACRQNGYEPTVLCCYSVTEMR